MIVGDNMGRFPKGLSAIALCVDFQGDFSLATGGDLSRERDGCTPSAGLDFLYVEGCLASVLKNKAV